MTSSAKIGKEELWNALVETVHALPMYPHQKRYVKDVLLVEKPDLQARELSILLNMPFGEALVMLNELSGKSGPDLAESESVQRKEKTLFDFGGK
jgi:hypothetical protein